ncbi:MAG: hypothetical protein L0G69_12790 [Brevibacterium sp.]|nr:hypothetical protein [Brevibacterium sp.]
MRSIPRLVAGTAVVLAAVLTTAPVTAGIADFVLNPGQQPVKRAAPALTGSTTSPLAPIRTRDDDRAAGSERSGDDERTGEGERSGDLNRFQVGPSTHTGPSSRDASDSVTTDISAMAEHSAGLVAHTAADAQSRVRDLASDLQSGVDAGEFSQSDADRVLGDLSSYIKGERTWPERSVA